MLPSIVHERSLNGLISMKMMGIICCGLRTDQTSTQLNAYGRFCANILDRALLFLEEWCFIPPGVFQRHVKSMPRHTETALVAHSGPAPNFMLFFSIDFSSVWITVFSRLSKNLGCQVNLVTSKSSLCQSVSADEPSWLKSKKHTGVHTPKTRLLFKQALWETETQTRSLLKIMRYLIWSKL